MLSNDKKDVAKDPKTFNITIQIAAEIALSESNEKAYSSSLSS